MLSLLRIALRNLFVDRERALLLFLVIASGSAVLVGVMSLKTGVAAAQREAARTLLSGDVNVGGYFKVHPDTLAPVLGDTPRVRSVVEPLVPAGCGLRERGRGYATVAAGRHRVRSFLVGLDAGHERELVQRMATREGSVAALERTHTVALSAPLARQLQVKVGDVTTLYTQLVGGKNNALDVEVAAITEPVGLLGESSGILVSNATLRELHGYRPESASVLQLTCAGDTDVDALAGTVRETLRTSGFTVLPASHEAYGDKMAPLLREGWAGQRVDVSTWQDESSFLSFVTDGLGALAVLVGVIVFVVVVLGLFVSLNVSVRERTREIGTLRAMGMHRRSVVGMFVLEGLLLGVLASASGAAVSALLCVGLRGSVPLPEAISNFFFSGTLPLQPELPHAVVAVVLVTVGAVLASIIPAARAASLSPRSAMEFL
ncbi:FtsX-like permease family protein [Archangium violaceum]|uniref:ABC transporter permease n=1 Tax=Archangium violaceum TaxID=83451 RepID=UPI002B290F7B|nr:FtsX-like permease family protein [Archangium gephyra]